MVEDNCLIGLEVNGIFSWKFSFLDKISLCRVYFINIPWQHDIFPQW
jgi:hypothetical protein